MPPTPQLPAQRSRFFSKRVAIAAVVLVLATAAAAGAQTLMGSGPSDVGGRTGKPPKGAGSRVIDDREDYILRERARKARQRAEGRNDRIEQTRARQKRAAAERSDRLRAKARAATASGDRLRSGSRSSSGGTGSGGDRLRGGPPPPSGDNDRLR